MPIPPTFLSVLVTLMCATLCPVQAQALPTEVKAALARAKVPEDALAMLVADAQDQSTPRVSHRSAVAMNPASVMKLVTTYAALDLLGPAYSWRTPVYLEGAVREGTLYGNLYIQGQGDPKLVLERLWLLLRRVQGLGIKSIAGDVVLDNRAFDLPPTDPASFDGEPLRPYNAAPDALLINYKTVVMTFTPDRSANIAQVQFDPALAGVQMQSTVPLTSDGNSAADCGDYRDALKADFSDSSRIRFGGSYPANCEEKAWSVAYADAKTYSVRAVQALWAEMGGKLAGTVRMGAVPATLQANTRPAFEVTSAPLAEVIRDINKYSNNVMAQQLFLTLGRVVPTANGDTSELGARPGNFAASRAVVQRWWSERLGSADAPVLDNGSGLSRDERITASGLVHLLQSAYRSPLMPELMASLSIPGVDGTLRRVQPRPGGSAHLKTGSLSNVLAVAGYVHGTSGKRYALVAIVNHPNANAARPAIEALVDWAMKDRAP